MFDRHPNRSTPAGDTAAGFTIGSVTATPASRDSPVAYEYSDLTRGGDRRLMALVHLVYWPVYLLLFLTVQYPIRLFRWSVRYRHLTPAGRLEVLILDTIANLRKLTFLTSRDRAVLYLRSSRVLTPAQVVPGIPGSAPIAADPTTSSEGPDSWSDITREVLKRDGYHCANCEAAGGPYGSAELHVDHILPRSKGGSDELWNLRTLCRACHEARHARLFRSGGD